MPGSATTKTVEQSLADATALLKVIDERTTGLNGKVDNVIKTVSDLQTRVEVIETNSKERITGQGGQLPGVDPKHFSFSRAMKGIVTGNWKNSGYEKEVFDNTDGIREKAMGYGSGAAGGYLIPEELLGPVIDKLRERVVLANAGARFFNNLSGAPIRIPRIASDATADVIAEGSNLTISSITTEQVTMNPRQLMAAVALGNVLNTLDPSVADDIIVDNISKMIALKLDEQGLQGTGNAPYATGLAVDANTIKYAPGTNGDTPTQKFLGDLIGQLEDNNAFVDSTAAFIWHSKVKRLIKNERIAHYSGQTDGLYVLQPTMSDQQLADTLGYRHFTSNQIPVNLTKNAGSSLSRIIFGDFSNLAIGLWGGLDVLASNTASDGSGNSAFLSNQTWIRVVKLFDIGILQPKQFAIATYVTTS